MADAFASDGCMPSMTDEDLKRLALEHRALTLRRPDALRDSPNRRARHVKRTSVSRWYPFLCTQGPLSHFVLRVVSDLGLPREVAQPDTMFDRERIRQIVRRVERDAPAHRGQLHLGRSRIVHVHLIAPSAAGLPGFRTPLEDTYQAAYLRFRPFADDLVIEGLYLAAKAHARKLGQRLPSTAWVVPHHRSRARRTMLQLAHP